MPVFRKWRIGKVFYKTPCFFQLTEIYEKFLEYGSIQNIPMEMVRRAVLPGPIRSDLDLVYQMGAAKLCDFGFQVGGEEWENQKRNLTSM